MCLCLRVVEVITHYSQNKEACAKSISRLLSISSDVGSSNGTQKQHEKLTVGVVAMNTLGDVRNHALIFDTLSSNYLFLSLVKDWISVNTG